MSNIFLHVIPEPAAVKLRTNQYKEETNEVAQWVNENITFEKGSFLDSADFIKRRNIPGTLIIRNIPKIRFT